MVNDPEWVDAGSGYAVAIDPAGTVLCRNAKGALQRAVPAAVRKSPVGQQAVLAGDWLARHTRDCMAAVERWLVRSLPVPVAVAAGVWADPAWRAALRNAVIVVADRRGLLREADPARGVALLDPAGTTTWHAGGTLLVPHPVLLAEPAAYRKLLSELGDGQEVAQLYRDVFTRPAGAPGWWYDAFAGVEVERLSTLMTASARLGYQVRQGWATCRVWEGGRRIEAQFLLGEGDPAAPAETGSITWRVGRGELLRLGDVGPIAWSEGVRMAALCLGRAPAEPAAASAAPVAVGAEPAAGAPDGAVDATAAMAVLDRLRAGGLIEPDLAMPDGPVTDPLTARGYRRPGLGDRPVIRLVPEPLVPAEDATVALLGFTPADPAVHAAVARARRAAVGFPAWVVLHEPDHAALALGMLPELDRLAGLAQTKPGKANDGYKALAAQLHGVVPRALPVFWEHAGRVFLGVENAYFAGQMYANARRVEREHGLVTDPAADAEVLVEFAGAGALTPNAVVTAAGTVAVDSVAALRDLLVRCVAAGLAPWPKIAEPVAQQAKRSGADPAAETRALVAALLPAAGTATAVPTFWAAVRDHVIAAAQADPHLQARLLDVVPAPDADENSGRVKPPPPAPWLDLLVDAGAIDLLAGPETASGRPAAWLGMLARKLGTGTVLRALADRGIFARLAPRLRADGVPVDLLGGGPQGGGVVLGPLDLALALGVPLADPPAAPPVQSDALDTDRDLAHIGADARFAPVVGAAVRAALAAKPGGAAGAFVAARPVLHAAADEWFAARAAELVAGNLKHLRGVLDRPIHADLLRARPESAAMLRGVNVGAVLARTLRDGLLDELGWPALEEAAALLGDGVTGNVSWPNLVLCDDRTVVVVTPDGIGAVHPMPPQFVDNRPYALTAGDDVLLWAPTQQQDSHGVWLVHGGAMTGSWRGRVRHLVLARHCAPLPDGARTEGNAPIQPGAADLSRPCAVFSDGTGYWRLPDAGARLVAFDPATGAILDDPPPPLLAPGRGVDLRLSYLLPPPRPGAGPVGLRCEAQSTPTSAHRTDGVSVTLSGRGTGYPVVAIFDLPGDDEPRPLLGCDLHNRYDELLFAGPNGVGDIAACTLFQRRPPDAPGTALVPPPACWALLTPRDEPGSLALRAATDDLGTALIAAAADDSSDAVTEAVARLLPEVTHPGLLLGVTHVVRQAVLLAVQVRQAHTPPADAAAADGAADARPVRAVPVDDVILKALRDLVPRVSGRWSAGAGDSLVAHLRAVGEFLRGGAQERTVVLPDTAVLWPSLVGPVGAVAFRCGVAPGTGPDERDLLVEVLREWAGAGLATVAYQARSVSMYAPPRLLERLGVSGPWVALARGESRYVIHVNPTDNPEGRSCIGVEFAPRGEFTVPAGFRLHRERPLRTRGWAVPPWVDRFAELLRERGPVPWSAAAPALIAKRTALTTEESIVLWAGLPDLRANQFLTADLRRTLGLKTAVTKGRKRFAAIRDHWQPEVPAEERLAELLDPAITTSPADLWEPLGAGPDDPDSPAARVADAWLARNR
jgi:hypothetical protein